MCQHSDADKHATDIRHHPAGIGNYGKRRVLGSGTRVAVIAALIKGLIGEPQRVIHPDRLVFIDISSGIANVDL